MVFSRLTAFIWIMTAAYLAGCDSDRTENSAAPPHAVIVAQTTASAPAAEPGPETPPPQQPVAATKPVPDVAMTQPGLAASPEHPAPPFQPLGDARLGEWAVYRDINSQILRYEIREVGLSRVKTEIAVTFKGRMLGMPAVREDLRETDPMTWKPPAGASRQTRRTTIDAAGREWNAILYEDQWIDEDIAYVRRTWVSSAAPVMGIVRMELTGDGQLEARLELIEAGEGK